MSGFKNVLIVQPYGIGDLLFITPVLRALRALPTVQRVDMILGSRTKTVVQNNPHVDDIFVIDKDKMHRQSSWMNFTETVSLGKKLRSRKYDLLLDYSIRGENAFFSQFFLGISKRAGYAYKNRAFFHNIKVPIENGFWGKHVVEFACELAEKSGVPVLDKHLEFYFGLDDETRIAEKLSSRIDEKYLTLSCGGGESWGKDASLKRWPPERFARLVEALKMKYDFTSAIIVGSPGEVELNNILEKKLSVPVENFTGELSLDETAYVIKKSRLFVGNDGGLIHLAKAVHCPVVGLYGPARPTEYGPFPLGNEDVAIFKERTDGKRGYYRFRYDSNDSSITDLSVDDALKQLENREVSNAPTV